ncbi:MAG: hypothetical protein K0B14_18540 [Anaerolineaceae bacterium]|nr:hypothetical protein [Anaerolineaceae bacterium]
MVKMEVSVIDPQTEKVINWLIENQQSDGLWKLNYFSDTPEKSSPEIMERKMWVSLAICRIFKNLQD